jgi:restriction system protein
MKVTDAVEHVLLKTVGSLHVSKITRMILSQGLWVSEGKTPEQTVSAALSVDVRKHGDRSRFIRTGKSTYGLNPALLNQSLLQTKKMEIEPVPVSEHTKETLSFTDAAEYVLHHFSGQQPMHYQAITDKALEMELISTEGLTPAATMYAQIITEIERKKKRGEQPRFEMHGKGMVGLAAWESQGLAGLIENHNREIRGQLLHRLQEMPAKQFEKLIALLLTALGFEDVIVTPYSGDKGIDVRATLVVGESIRTRMAVQVKRWKRNVQSPVVQQVRGSLSTHDQGLIITTSDFSKGAYEEARMPDKIPVALMSGEQLVDLLIENNIGVKRESHDLMELAQDDD